MHHLYSYTERESLILSARKRDVLQMGVVLKVLRKCIFGEFYVARGMILGRTHPPPPPHGIQQEGNEVLNLRVHFTYMYLHFVHLHVVILSPLPHNYSVE